MPEISPSEHLLDDLQAVLAEARAVLRAAVDSVPEALRDECPAPDRWSVAEILEHLARVESAVTRVLASAASAELPEAPEGDVSGYDRTLILDRSRKIEAGERAQPTGAMAWSQAWDALTLSRQALIDTLRAGDPQRLARLRVPHFVFGTLDGEAWTRFLGGHEERHAAQIREVGVMLQGCS